MTHRRLLSVLAGVILTLGSIVVAAGPSFAAVTPFANCSGYSCHGYDPFYKQCAATHTVSAGGGANDLATVWNEYSSGCNANWAEAQISPAAHAAGDSIVVEVYTTKDSHGTTEDMCYPGPSNTGQLVECSTGQTYGGTAVAWTDMVDGTNVAIAFVFVYNGSNFITDYSVSQ